MYDTALGLSSFFVVEIVFLSPLQTLKKKGRIFLKGFTAFFCKTAVHSFRKKIFIFFEDLERDKKKLPCVVFKTNNLK